MSAHLAISSIERQERIVVVRRQGSHRVDDGKRLSRDHPLNTSLPIKFHFFLAVDASCLDRSSIHRQDEANTTCPTGIFGVKKITDMQAGEKRLAVSHDLIFAPG